jgi:hypothetical protein
VGLESVRARSFLRPANRDMRVGYRVCTDLGLAIEICACATFRPQAVHTSDAKFRDRTRATL